MGFFIRPPCPPILRLRSGQVLRGVVKLLSIHVGFKLRKMVLPLALNLREESGFFPVQVFYKQHKMTIDTYQDTKRQPTNSPRTRGVGGASRINHE